jgi:hypothetical protein
MVGIVRGNTLGPSARIGATSTLSKIANTGAEKDKEATGPKFSIMMNLGGEPMRIEAPIQGEVVDEQ